MVNIILFPLGEKCTFSRSSSATYSRISTAPGEFNQVQSHNLNVSKVDQKVMQRGVISAKITLNWGQHVEFKLQAISFIHIKLGKVGKCAKLIRLIDFIFWLTACSCPPIWT